MKYKKLSEARTIEKEDYSKSVIFENEELPGEGHLLQMVTIPPKTKQRKHYHNKQTEVFYILEGKCSIFVNDVEYIASSGDSFVCEPLDTHYLWNREDQEFKLLVFKINKDVGDDDTVWKD